MLYTEELGTFSHVIQVKHVGTDCLKDGYKDVYILSVTVFQCSVCGIYKQVPKSSTKKYRFAGILRCL